MALFGNGTFSALIGAWVYSVFDVSREEESE